MYFILEIEFRSQKRYISDLIRSFAAVYDIDIEVLRQRDSIVLVCKKDQERLGGFLNALENVLPASIFLGKSKHYFSDTKPTHDTKEEPRLPLHIAPCPNCQKEMFDVSSRRYYYPFTSCNVCGSQHPLVERYPFKRENTLMKFFVPCEVCQEELKKNPFRKEYSLISCIECGVALKMTDKKSERIANDKGAYRRLFEVSAQALKKGKMLLVKTMHGFRKFYLPTQENVNTKTHLMMTDANRLNTHLMMVPQEWSALLSIERPLLLVATKSEELKALFGTSVHVKYADDGVSMLLAKELMNCEIAYVAYEVCDGDEVADYRVDFDLPIVPQKETKLFINQDTKLFVSGERIVYPCYASNPGDVVAIAHDLAATNVDGRTIIDKMERFSSFKTPQVRILEDEPIESSHSNEMRFKQYEASMMSVLAEHGKLGEKAVRVHFDTALYFLYYNGKKVINAVPPVTFESKSLFEKIKALREGSDRLVENYKEHFPDIYERLCNLNGDEDIFKVTAITLGLEDESLEGISAEALSFLGKGGLQIDTRIKDNRFDNYAFLASIMSYQIAGVETNYLCYSIYESFGDYIGEIVPQLAEKAKTRTIVLSGETFANQALYARIQRTLGVFGPLMNKNLPIGKENAVYGALYL